MKGNQTILQDVTGEDEERTFTYDYSFWSHDGSTKKADGYYVPDSPSSPYVD